jgi:FkbM family methyltransferase
MPAKSLYRATPIPAVRQFYFDAFCRLVRGRRMHATIDGSTFELDLSETIDVSVLLGEYERDVTSALRQHCRPGMTVLDIGANMGAHTLPIARIVGESGAVYAFEPTDLAYAKLTANLALNRLPQAHSIKVALSDVAAPRQVVTWRSSWRTDRHYRKVQSLVDFARLDDVCNQRGITSVDVVKIDTDGNEFGALAGGNRTLERSRPIIIMEAIWPHFVHDERNPFELLKRAGYRFSDARSGTQYKSVAEMARRFPPYDPEITMSFNVIALPTL